MARDHKFNPFRPGDIVSPGMFVGRAEEIDAIERCLFQTKNGNPQNFAILGERGIGKSSLLFYIEHLSRGEKSDFDFVTVAVDISSCRTDLDIVRKLGRELRIQLGHRQALIKSAQKFWDWLTNWEILGVKYQKRAGDFDAEEVAEQFVSNLAGFSVATAGQTDGVLFLIDEADRPPVEADLGAFLKATSERLTKARCNQVAFGLAGLPTLITRMRESHDSSPRLLHTMRLDPLTMEERTRVVQFGLADANRRNKRKTDIDADALDYLAELSEGYPNFVQQFAYYAFEVDTDDRIGRDDVTSGAFREGGALAQLGEKYFSELYHARISSDDYRRVLDAMAHHGDKWVARKQIMEESGVGDSNIKNALNALKERNIILNDETRRGFYRLPTKSFAAWINAIGATQPRLR